MTIGDPDCGDPVQLAQAELAHAEARQRDPWTVCIEA